jgi:dynein heavy chain 1
MQTDFIRQVVELKADDIPENVKTMVLSEYLNTPQFDVDLIANASQAAGALASWAKSQLSYADILTKVNPMKAESVELEEEGNRLRTTAE